MIKILNKRNGDKGVYCGRPSPLGNPFHMRNEKDRDEVCDRYQEWFDDMVRRKNPQVMRELNRLKRILDRDGELNLLCWCAPKRCHCETIKRCLESGQISGKIPV